MSATAPLAPARIGRDGALRLRFERRGPATVVAGCRYTLPLQVLAPVALDDPAAVVSILNPTGGLVGGDRLSIDVEVGAGAHALLTTPSATRVYRTDAEDAVQSVKISIGPQAAVEWVPDHTIPFAGSALRQTLDVDMDATARLILVDAFSAGRIGRGEAWQFAVLDSAVSVRDQHGWLLCDRLLLRGPMIRSRAVHGRRPTAMLRGRRRVGRRGHARPGRAADPLPCSERAGAHRHHRDLLEPRPPGPPRIAGARAPKGLASNQWRNCDGSVTLGPGSMFNLIPKEVRFFDYFEQQSQHIIRAGALLHEMVHHFADARAKAHAIKEVEHQGDHTTHEIIKKLNTTFITPIDREDIHDLASRLDDVLDYIEAAAERLVVYRIKEPTSACRAMADVIVQTTLAMDRTIKCLRTMDPGFHEHTVEVNRLENTADVLLRDSLAAMFEESSDPIEVIKWKEIYETMEIVTDRCEDVANVIEGIILKMA